MTRYASACDKPALIKLLVAVVSERIEGLAHALGPRVRLSRWINDNEAQVVDDASRAVEWRVDVVLLFLLAAILCCLPRSGGMIETPLHPPSLPSVHGSAGFGQ